MAIPLGPDSYQKKLKFINNNDHHIAYTKNISRGEYKINEVSENVEFSFYFYFICIILFVFAAAFNKSV